MSGHRRNRTAPKGPSRAASSRTDGEHGDDGGDLGREEPPQLGDEQRHDQRPDVEHQHRQHLARRGSGPPLGVSSLPRAMPKRISRQHQPGQAADPDASHHCARRRAPRSTAGPRPPPCPAGPRPRTRRASPSPGRGAFPLRRRRFRPRSAARAVPPPARPPTQRTRTLPFRRGVRLRTTGPVPLGFPVWKTA